MTREDRLTQARSPDSSQQVPAADAVCRAGHGGCSAPDSAGEPGTGFVLDLDPAEPPGPAYRDHGASEGDERVASFLRRQLSGELEDSGDALFLARNEADGYERALWALGGEHLDVPAVRLGRPDQLAGSNELGSR